MSAQTLLAVVTGVLALLSAGILALLNGWISGRAGIDENLRSQRLDLYPTLWSITAAVSVWPRNDITRHSLGELHRSLRSWYYTKGGLFMSKPTRDRYGDVQKLIAALLTHDGEPADVLARDRYTDLMNTASALRAALTQDLDTRRRKSLREDRRRSRWHHEAAQQANERIVQAEASASAWERHEDARGKRPGWRSRMSMTLSRSIPMGTIWGPHATHATEQLPGGHP